MSKLDDRLAEVYKSGGHRAYGIPMTLRAVLEDLNDDGSSSADRIMQVIKGRRELSPQTVSSVLGGWDTFCEEVIGHLHEKNLIETDGENWKTGPEFKLNEMLPVFSDESVRIVPLRNRQLEDSFQRFSTQINTMISNGDNDQMWDLSDMGGMLTEQAATIRVILTDAAKLMAQVRDTVVGKPTMKVKKSSFRKQQVTIEPKIMIWEMFFTSPGLWMNSAMVSGRYRVSQNADPGGSVRKWLMCGAVAGFLAWDQETDMYIGTFDADLHSYQARMALYRSIRQGVAEKFGEVPARPWYGEQLAGLKEKYGTPQPPVAKKVVGRWKVMEALHDSQDEGHGVTVTSLRRLSQEWRRVVRPLEISGHVQVANTNGQERVFWRGTSLSGDELKVLFDQKVLSDI